VPCSIHLITPQTISIAVSSFGDMSGAVIRSRTYSVTTPRPRRRPTTKNKPILSTIAQQTLISINDNRKLIEARFPNKEPSARLLRLHPDIIKAALEGQYGFQPKGPVLLSLQTFFDDSTEEDLLEGIEIYLDALKYACEKGLDEDQKIQSSEAAEDNVNHRKFA